MIVARNEIVYQAGRHESAAIRHANRPIVMVNLEVLESRMHGPFPLNGVPVTPAEEAAAANRDDNEHVPRPRNAWIIYRQSLHRQIKEDPTIVANMDMKQICKSHPLSIPSCSNNI